MEGDDDYMKKVTLLLSAVFGLCTAPGGSYGTENTQLVLKGANSYKGELFDAFEYANSVVLPPKIKKTDVDDLYTAVFSTDLLKTEKFGDVKNEQYTKNELDLNHKIEDVVNTINNIHGVKFEVLENFGQPTDDNVLKSDKLNVPAVKDFVASYLTLLMDVRLAKLKADYNDHWSTTEQRKKDIKNLIDIAANVLTDEDSAPSLSKYDFSRNDHKMNYAVRLVLRQMFENIREEYMKCVEKDRVGENINYVVGERDVSKDRSGTNGDSFLDFNTLHEWLLLKQLTSEDRANDEIMSKARFVFHQKNPDLINESFFEKAFDDENAHENFLGIEVLKICLHGVAEKYAKGLLDDKDEFIKNVSETFDKLESHDVLRNAISKFKAIKERLKDSKNEIEKLKSEFGVDILDEEKQDDKTNEDVLNTCLSSIKEGDKNLKDYLQNTLSSIVGNVLKQIPKGEEITADLFFNIIDLLKNDFKLWKSNLDDFASKTNSDYNKALNAIYGDKKCKSLKKSVQNNKEPIENFFNQLLTNDVEKLVSILSSSFEQFEKNCIEESKTIRKNLVALNGDIYRNNKEIFDDVKTSYFSLVANILAYFMDLGIVDETRSETPFGGYRSNILTLKQVITLNNRGNFGAGSTSSGEMFDGMRDSTELTEWEQKSRALSKLNDDPMSTFKALKQIGKVASPENVNSIMIPGVFRKCAMMFCNMTDKNSSLYYSHIPPYLKRNTIVAVSQKHKDIKKTTELIYENSNAALKAFKDVTDYLKLSDPENKELSEKLNNLGNLLKNGRLLNAKNTQQINENVTDQRFIIRDHLSSVKNIEDSMKKISSEFGEEFTALTLYARDYKENLALTAMINFVSTMNTRNDTENKNNELKNCWIKGRDILKANVDFYKKRDEQFNVEYEKLKYEETISNLQKKIETLEAKQTKNNTEDTNADNNSESKDELERQITILKDQLKNANQNKETALQQIETLKKELENARKNCDEKTKQYDEARKKFDEQKVNNVNVNNYQGGEGVPPPPPPPPPPPAVPIITEPKIGVQRNGSKNNVKRNNNAVIEPRMSLEEQLKAVRLKAVSKEEDFDDPKNKDNKVTVLSKDFNKKADEWLSRKKALASKKTLNEDERYELDTIEKNLKILKQKYNINPKEIDQRNFLKEHLSSAIKQRFKNLHLHEEEEDDDDDF